MAGAVGSAISEVAIAAAGAFANASGWLCGDSCEHTMSRVERGETGFAA